MSQDKKIWFAILTERCVYDRSLKMAMHLSYVAALHGYNPIFSMYGRTDVTRQGIVEIFLEKSTNPTDTLVMLDVDHDHPADLIEKLVAHDVEMVAPLMFRRQQPYQACAFRMDDKGDLHHLASFPPGLHKMDGLGSGAIAIQRKVFTRLREAGHYWFFKYEYDNGFFSPSEDMYFSKLCREVGVEMYVDTTIESPHMNIAYVDKGVYEDYTRDNPAGQIAL